MKAIFKRIIQGIFLTLLFPCALLAVFGRFRIAYEFFAQACALVPGLPGDYARGAFYKMTLRDFSLESRISFGTFFAHPDVTLARQVFIGSHCIMGRVRIGQRTQIASRVLILSGRHQHSRDEQGRILGSEQGTFAETRIGDDCWIGTAAIVMADVGPGSTVGAGAVVTRNVPPGVVVIGNPARVLARKSSEISHGESSNVPQQL